MAFSTLEMTDCLVCSAAASSFWVKPLLTRASMIARAISYSSSDSSSALRTPGLVSNFFSYSSHAVVRGCLCSFYTMKISQLCYI